MSLLPNYPMVAQRTDYTADGLPSENKEMNCVPSSILSMIMYLLGIKQVDQEWDPDRILNMAYPEGYQGGTEASKFVDACKQFGIHLFPVDGDNATLVSKAHQYLAQGKPVLFTIVDPYMPANSGYTHVCVWFSDGAGTLTAMDPWPARPVTHSDGEWEAVMRFNEIWIAERITMSTLDTLKQHNWHDDGTRLVAPNDVPVVRGFRGYILAHNWNPDNWPLAPEYGTPQLEGSNPSLGGGTQQVFRWTMLGWTEANGVFEEWTGQELLYLSKKVADYYKQVQDLQKQLQGGQPVPATDPLASQALAVVRQIKPLVQAF